MLNFGYGFLGLYSNNATEIEGLIQGIEWVFENFHRPIIAEGDSQLIVLLASKLQNGSQSTNFSSSWRLESRITALRLCLINENVVSFMHVRRNGNKVADNLANLGVGTCQYLTKIDWNLLPDLIACTQCQDFINRDCTGFQMAG